MTDRQVRLSGSAHNKGPEAELNQKLNAELTESEKIVRDLELLESANKYFGGLTDGERSALGLEGGKTPVKLSERLTNEGELQTKPPKMTVRAGHDWMWAGLTLLIFLAVVGWVVAGR
jgi:hypothetical protein